MMVQDVDRDAYLGSLGWRVFRIGSHQNLTKEELRKRFLELPLINE